MSKYGRAIIFFTSLKCDMCESTEAALWVETDGKYICGACMQEMYDFLDYVDRVKEVKVEE